MQILQHQILSLSRSIIHLKNARTQFQQQVTDALKNIKQLIRKKPLANDLNFYTVSEKTKAIVTSFKTGNEQIDLMQNRAFENMQIVFKTTGELKYTTDEQEQEGFQLELIFFLQGAIEEYQTIKNELHKQEAEMLHNLHELKNLTEKLDQLNS